MTTNIHTVLFFVVITNSQYSLRYDRSLEMKLIMIIAICCEMLISLVSIGFTCSDSRQTFKSELEGPFLSENHRLYSVLRRTEYRCENNIVTTEVSRELLDYVPQFRSRHNTFNADFFKHDEYSGFGECVNDCSEKQVLVNVSVSGRSADRFLYTNKDCAKFYFTNWVEISNCATSHTITFRRDCLNCENKTVNGNFCLGNTTRQKSYPPSWSDWSKSRPCSNNECVILCERVRTRSCLYADGSEASNSLLCSNASIILKEKCNANSAYYVKPLQPTLKFPTNLNMITSSKIFLTTSTPTVYIANFHSYTYFSAGIGVGAILMLLFLIACFRKRLVSKSIRNRNDDDTYIDVIHNGNDPTYIEPDNADYRNIAVSQIGISNFPLLDNNGFDSSQHAHQTNETGKEFLNQNNQNQMNMLPGGYAPAMSTAYETSTPVMSVIYETSHEPHRYESIPYAVAAEVNTSNRSAHDGLDANLNLIEYQAAERVTSNSELNNSNEGYMAMEPLI